MNRTFILAGSRVEAVHLARLVGFQRAPGPPWDVLTTESAMGCRGNVVLSTGLDCWRRQRDHHEVQDIGALLISHDFKVVRVPCPGDWMDMGFDLPEDWAEPRTYAPKVVLHPPAPKKRSLWRRFPDFLEGIFGGD